MSKNYAVIVRPTETPEEANSGVPICPALAFYDKFMITYNTDECRFHVMKYDEDNDPNTPTDKWRDTDYAGFPLPLKEAYLCKRYLDTQMVRDTIASILRTQWEDAYHYYRTKAGSLLEAQRQQIFDPEIWDKVYLKFIGDLFQYLEYQYHGKITKLGTCIQGLYGVYFVPAGYISNKAAKEAVANKSPDAVKGSFEVYSNTNIEGE